METKQKSKIHSIKTPWVKKSFKYQALLVSLFVVLFVFTQKAGAIATQPIKKGDIIINELMWMGMGEDSSDEWIELRNMTSREINLADVYIKNGGSGTTGITIPAGNVIATNGYFVIAKRTKESSQSRLLFSENGEVRWLQISEISLLDGGEELVLRTRDGVEGEDLDVVWKKAKWPAGENPAKEERLNGKIKKSMERNGVIANGTIETSWHTCVSDPIADIIAKNCGTPGAKNSKKVEEQVEPLPPSERYSKDVRINELLPYPNSGENEFVELYNEGADAVALDGWIMKDEAGKTCILDGKSIDAHDFLVLENNTAENCTIALNNSGGEKIFLFNPNKEAQPVSQASYDELAKQGYSYSLIGAQWLWTLSPTKGEENIFKEYQEKPTDDIKVENKMYSNSIAITELFPNPFKHEYEEYIELHNDSSQEIDLFGWTLSDASKSGKYIFPESIVIKAKEYLAIFKKDFKFALNNSGDESVTLFDPNGKEVSNASYETSKKNVSYNFDGSRFRWSKFLTPGKENVLNNEPYGKVKIDDDVYKKVYADFSVSTGDGDGDKVKVTWDFGDGRKSYLKKTRHKYEKEGRYEASVKLSDGSEDVLKTFTIEVKKYPHPKVRIVAINANPEGKDSVFETITIENKSKKKINLKGWSIATGSKNLVNHPIAEKLEIKKKEIKEITREFSKFSLNNKKGKIELRYPDGEIADKVKYEKKEGIKENEKYIKTEGVWKWSAISQKSVKPIKQNSESQEKVNDKMQEENVDGEVAGVEVIKREYSFVMFESKVVIGKMEFKNSDARVSGAETVREVDGRYFLTPQGKEQKHYAVTFFNDALLVVNLKLNTLLNYFK